ncbi:MAG: hypothetical protein K6G09_02805 [Treponema sp.]|nr:hypothetical protein [Treponema sp.]
MQAFGGLYKKSAYWNRLDDLYFQKLILRMKVVAALHPQLTRLRKQAGHKAERYCVADA